MTNNFLKHKEIYDKYKKQSIPRDEMERMKYEEDCT